MFLIKSYFSNVLFLIPIYIWYKFYSIKKQLNLELKNKQTFYDKHNCTVMYNKTNGMAGWPEYKECLELNIHTYEKFADPILYFIDTASKSLDIAMMTLKASTITESLLNALKRGVAVRIVLDYNYMRQDSEIIKLRNAGSEIMYYINTNVESLLHCKYVVKDYSDADRTGFTVTGSLNWTESGTQHNYEDIVFSSAKSIVHELHKNYEEMWEYLDREQILNASVNSTLNEHL